MCSERPPLAHWLLPCLTLCTHVQCARCNRLRIQWPLRELIMDTEFRDTSQITINPNSSHIRAAKLSTTMKVTVQSTRKGLVTINTARAAIIRFLMVSLDVMAYCSKNMNCRSDWKCI